MGSSYINHPGPGGPSTGMNSRLPLNGADRANEKYDVGSGYGANRYDMGGVGGGGGDGGATAAAGSRYGQGSSDGPTPSRYGPGGYGGLGRTSSAETSKTDINREALFGDAQNRYQQRSHAAAAPNNQVGGGGGGSGYGGTPGVYGDNGGGYGAYGENRQLTAEEAEEEDVQATKQQIRQMKREDVASTRNALRIAAQAEETGRNTLARLAAQGERIHNTERNLDLATNQGRIAEERAKELKTLNKSMFAVHVSNPFTSAERRRLRDEDVMNKHRTEREQRDASRAAAFESKARVEGSWKELGGSAGAAGNNKAKSTLAERAKYQFEADSEDDEMENEIDSNLDALGQAAGRLNVLARATGREVDEQNKHIDTIISKVGKTVRYGCGGG